MRATDFENCLKDVRSGDFVYLDPPYTHAIRPTYGEYGYDGFSESDISRLLECLARVHRSGATFLLSYSDVPAVQVKLSKAWHIRKLTVRRHVAGFAEHRANVSEVLVSNQPL